jgi:hypothetical protein
MVDTEPEANLSAAPLLMPSRLLENEEFVDLPGGDFFSSLAREYGISSVFPEPANTEGETSGPANEVCQV